MLYALAGRETEGAVTSVYNYKVGWNFNRIAEYEFAEADGARRTGRTIVPSDWNAPVGGNVRVLYAPGGRSRLAGHADWSSVILFFLTLGAVFLVAVVWLLRAVTHRVPARRRRAKRPCYE